jgi:hypothetical protein
MVVIHVKGSDGDAFLFETTTDTKNEELIHSLVELQNLRLRCKVIVDSVRGLAQYGMMKDPSVVAAAAVAENNTEHHQGGAPSSFVSNHSVDQNQEVRSLEYIYNKTKTFE